MFLHRILFYVFFTLQSYYKYQTLRMLKQHKKIAIDISKFFEWNNE